MVRRCYIRSRRALLVRWCSGWSWLRLLRRLQCFVGRGWTTRLTGRVIRGLARVPRRSRREIWSTPNPSRLMFEGSRAGRLSAVSRTRGFNEQVTFRRSSFRDLNWDFRRSLVTWTRQNFVLFELPLARETGLEGRLGRIIGGSCHYDRRGNRMCS
jgi:hypothetical protein